MKAHFRRQHFEELRRFAFDVCVCVPAFRLSWGTDSDGGHFGHRLMDSPFVLLQEVDVVEADADGA